MNDLEHFTDGPEAGDCNDENLPYGSQSDLHTPDIDAISDGVTDEHDEYSEDEDEANGPDDSTFEDAPVSQAAALDPVAHLPLDLTLRCGQLNLSLGQLRHLGAGTVLIAAGVTPGFATLCHGDRVVAEGELVDVDGRLGIQITRTAVLS